MGTLIFVFGTGRSGSTMLNLMLGNASDAFSCGEVHAWFRPFRKHHFAIDCPCGQDPCPIWGRISHVPENRFHATVVKELGVRFVIDSSKDLCWVIDAQRWAAASDLATVNLLLWKNPLDLAYSYWKRGQNPSQWRRAFVKVHRRFFQVALPFVTVNFNDLVSNPQWKLEQICTAVGMPFFPGKERFWEKQHHHLFGSGGIRRQVEVGESVIRPRESFPDEFAAKVELVQKQLETDSQVQQILEILRQADVSSMGQNDGRNHQFLPRKPYPVWYYGKKMIRSLRRYVPEQYDSTGFDHVETIPLGRR